MYTSVKEQYALFSCIYFVCVILWEMESFNVVYEGLCECVYLNNWNCSGASRSFFLLYYYYYYYSFTIIIIIVLYTYKVILLKLYWNQLWVYVWVVKWRGINNSQPIDAYFLMRRKFSMNKSLSFSLTYSLILL